MKANRTWTNSEINWESNAFPFKSSRESKPSAQPNSENFCMQFWSIEFNIRFFLILQIWAQFLNLISTISRCLALKLRWGVVPSTVGRWTNSLTASSRWREPPQVNIPPRHIDLKWLDNIIYLSSLQESLTQRTMARMQSRASILTTPTGPMMWVKFPLLIRAQYLRHLELISLLDQIKCNSNLQWKGVCSSAKV